MILTFTLVAITRFPAQEIYLQPTLSLNAMYTMNSNTWVKDLSPDYFLAVPHPQF